MARPNLDYEPEIVNIKLCLHPEHDRDLLDWFDNLPTRGRALAVITALRAGGAAIVSEAITSEDEKLTAVLDEMFF